MSTTICQRESTSKLNHEFSTSWEIKNLKYLRDDSIKTPSFSPIPNSDVAFHFEFNYMNNNDREATCKLVLFWNSCILNIPKSMKMSLTVTLEDDAIVLKTCEKNSISFDGKNSLVILNVIDKFYDLVYSNTMGYQQERNNKYILTNSSIIIIKCNLIFYEHLSTPIDYFHDKQVFKNLKDFADDFGSIYHPSLLSDIKFKIDNELLPAHKCILAAHSPVFLKMLSGDFLESKTNIVPIADSTPEMFNFFLKFLYCGEMEDKSWPVVKELGALADKYDVRTLKRNCGDLLVSFLSIENVCEILKLAYDLNDDVLKGEAKSFAVKYFNEISSRDDWKELVQSSPSIIYEVMLSFVPKST